MRAFEGEPVIDVASSETTAYNKDMPFFAVPIYDRGNDREVVAVLATRVLPQWADSILKKYYYGGNVFFNVIKTDGTAVFMSENPNVSWSNEAKEFERKSSLFDTIRANAEILSDITIEDMEAAAIEDRQESISFRFPHDNLIRTAQITPIGDTDFCVWMVATNEAIVGLHEQMWHKSFLAGGLIILCFSALIFLLFFLSRKILHLLMVDPVTGGYTAYRFNNEAEELIRKSSAGDYTFVSVNIENFKLMNDTYGYHEGNRILKHVHDTLKKHMEKGELLVRSSADNFSILIHSIRNERLFQELDQIANEVNSFNDTLSEKQWLMFKVGIYQIMDTDLMIVYIRDRANIARKKAKNAKVHALYSCGFYEEEDRVSLKHENVIKNKMHDALKNRDFKVYFQPKIDISTNKIRGAEALVRWQDKDMGLIPPDDFIPLFERIGFIRELDLYMFEQVCIYLRQWIDQGLQPVPVSVNLSRVHLKDKHFLLPFVEVQKKHRIPSELLELELTEMAFLDYQDEIQEAIYSIHKAGYACSLDDFGSGYSSLNNLETLDIDVLKLDRKFLQSARTKGDKGHIVIEELVHMASRLGITVCCEGVETEEQRIFLEECCCEMGQGYLFSRPIEAAAFESLAYGTQFQKKK